MEKIKKYVYKGPYTFSTCKIKLLNNKFGNPENFKYGDDVLIPEKLLSHPSLAEFLREGRKMPNFRHRLVVKEIDELTDSITIDESAKAPVVNTEEQLIQNEDTEIDVSKLTIAELKDFAELRKIDLTGLTLKKDIVRKIVDICDAEAEQKTQNND